MAEMDTYVCAAEETFDSIALREYGNERYAGKLMEVNGKYAHLSKMRGGEVLLMPEIQSMAAKTLPPWKRDE